MIEDADKVFLKVDYSATSQLKTTVRTSKTNLNLIGARDWSTELHSRSATGLKTIAGNRPLLKKGVGMEKIPYSPESEKHRPQTKLGTCAFTLKNHGSDRGRFSTKPTVRFSTFS